MPKSARAHLGLGTTLAVQGKTADAIAHFREAIDTAFLTFQKEVAERLAAKPGTKIYGRLSVLIQYCAKIYPVLAVAASAFFPKPKVDSQVVGVEFQHPLSFQATDERLLFQVVKAAFGKRRKTLRNALLGSDLGLGDEPISAALELAGIDPKRRAETLSVEEFVTLTNQLQGIKPPRNNSSPDTTESDTPD